MFTFDDILIRCCRLNVFLVAAIKNVHILLRLILYGIDSGIIRDSLTTVSVRLRTVNVVCFVSDSATVEREIVRDTSRFTFFHCASGTDDNALDSYYVAVYILFPG